MHGYKEHREFKLFKESGIKARVLMLAILPTLLISITLALFFIITRANDLQTSLEQRAKTIARQLAYASEFGLTTGNKIILGRLANITQQGDSDITGLMLFDAENQPSLPTNNSALTQRVIWSEKDIPVEEILIRTETSIKVYVPVTSHSLPLTEYDLTRWLRSGGEQLQLGYVVIEMSTAESELASYKSLLTSFMIIISSIILSILFAMRMAKGVTNPIITMAKAVDNIRQGALSTRVSTHSSGEMKILDEGINAMASSMQKAQEDMQHSIEQATADLTQTLETIEVQNIELDIARKQAQEASKTKSQFLANVSHEIRTPMNGVIGFCNLLLKTDLNDTQKEYMMTIKKSSRGLLTIIDDILDFSKIEAGKMEFETSSISLRSCVEDVLTILAPVANDKNLELVGLVYQDVPDRLSGDSLRINQILTNLINNAIKFTDKGSIVVRVMVEQEYDHELLIKIVVSDTGLGLNNEQQEKLFQSFTQADTTTTRKYGGTGLGLAISKNLVDKMGGEIGIDSVLGQGSDFWFTLKLQLAPGLSNPTLPLSHWKKLETYIYDPHKIANLVTTHHLQEWGFKTNSFENFDTFLAELNKTRIESSILISEKAPLLLISYKDGDDSLERLQNWINKQTNFQGKIIILCPDNFHPEINNQFQYPINKVLTKPLIASKLYSAIEHIYPQQLQEPSDEKLIFIPHKNLNNKIQILLVDDNEANLKLLCALLLDLSFQPVTAKNGFEAVEKSKNQTFDIIFMDIQMPGMDGIEATRKIRTDSINRQTPIIAVTAHAMKGEKENLLSKGLDDYLSKPINEDQLIKCLHHWTSTEITTSNAQQTDPAQAKTDLQDEYHPIDWELCLERANEKQDLAIDMLSMLVKSIPETRLRLKKHYQSQDLPNLIAAVHKLHGATCYTGVAKLKQNCLELEQELKSNGLSDKVASFYQSLIDEMELVEKEYEIVRENFS